MLIISNSLTEKTDEGCLKVVNSLVKRLKKKNPDTYVITYDRTSPLSDEHMKINKFMISSKLFAAVRKRKEKVLYLPFPAKPIATAIRIFSLSLVAKHGYEVALVMRSEFTGAAKLLLKMSNATALVFSGESAEYYKSIVGEKRVKYIKCGVDTGKFVPVSHKISEELKKKYGFLPDKPIVLHVGHLNEGRGVGRLLEISEKYQTVLVVSTLTKDEQDKVLKRSLADGNVKIIEDYIPDIQEIYQMSDVYFFPVTENGKCIDVPLSCMEAAACGLPVVCTEYGELKALLDKPGFYKIESFEKKCVNSLIENALSEKNTNIRNAVLQYDWDNGVRVLTE